MNVVLADLGERHRTFPKSVQPGIPKLGTLKPGWKRLKIGDLFDVVSRPCELVDADTYQLVTVKRSRGGIESRGDLRGSEIAVKSQFFIEEGDFLISKRQIVHGACAVVTAEFAGSIVSNEYAVLRCKPTLNIDFLRQLIHSIYFQETCFHSSMGVHVEKMIFSTPDWFRRKIDIPEVDEQREIADFLGSVDNRIRLLQRRVDALARYKSGVTQRLFDQSLRFTRDDGSAFPDWEERQISQLGKPVAGLAGKTAADFGAGQPYVTYKQIFGASKIDISECLYVAIDKDERQNRLRYGDVLFTTSSETSNEVGYASVLLDHPDELYLNSFCFALRPHSTEALLPQFARYLFRSPTFRRKVFPLAQGSTRYNLAKSSFLKLTLDVPHPDEQHKIADFLEALDEKIATMAAQADQMQRYKKALIQRMF